MHGGGQNCPPTLKSAKIVGGVWKVPRLLNDSRSFKNYEHFLSDIVILLTSALLSDDVSTFGWKYLSHWKSYNFWTNYRIKVVDPSFCSYKIAPYEKWCLIALSSHNFADVSTFSALFEPKTSCDVTWRHVTRFWQKSQKMFPSIISYLCPNMKSIG